MSLILRHQPEKFGVTLDEDGFASLSLKELASKISQKTGLFWVTEEAIVTVVNNPKNERFEIIAGKIRAKYGHSVKVNPSTSPLPLDSLPKFLFHGTSSDQSVLQSIMKEGLKSQGRQFVHLSLTREEALRVGRRKSRSPTILIVNIRKASEAGVKFWQVSNKVFVAEYVPPEALSFS